MRIIVSSNKRFIAQAVIEGSYNLIRVDNDLLMGIITRNLMDNSWYQWRFEPDPETKLSLSTNDLLEISMLMVLIKEHESGN